MIKKIIIFGGHIQALGLARQAHQEGIRVILLISDKYSVTHFSNSVDETLICRSFVDIKSKITLYEGKETLLFPTSDDYIDYFNENYAYLSSNFTLGVPSQECICIFSNKRNAYQFIKNNNIPQPQTWCPDSMADIENIANDVVYPIVLKPAVMYNFHKLFGKKAYLCKDKAELMDKCAHISQSFPIKHLMIQEFLAGGAKTLYSYGVFAQNGEPRAWVMANRIRQNPMDFGNSTTYAIVCNIPEIEQYAKKILSKTSYTGLAEIEFMYDRELDTYKFLEVNTRAWKWHTISLGLGFGFLSEMIKNMNGMRGDFCYTENRVAWVERLTDFSVIAKEIFKKRAKIKNLLFDYKLPKTNAVWTIKDPLPAIMYVLMAPILYIKRY